MYIATAEIKAGDELFTSYGTRYFETRGIQL
jgi:hypothetical protein